MAAGYIVRGQCVDASGALDALYSGIPPAVQAGSPSYITQFSKASTGWEWETVSEGVVVSSGAVVVPNLGTCDTSETFFDGLQLGWLVAAVMVGAYAVHLLRRGLM